MREVRLSPPLRSTWIKLINMIISYAFPFYEGLVFSCGFLLVCNVSLVISRAYFWVEPFPDLQYCYNLFHIWADQACQSLRLIRCHLFLMHSTNRGWAILLFVCYDSWICGNLRVCYVYTHTKIHVKFSRCDVWVCCSWGLQRCMPALVCRDAWLRFSDSVLERRHASNLSS
jgi:hypothetical protein